MIRRSVKAVWRRIAPTNYWVKQLAKMKRNSAEPEVRLLPALLAPGSVAVDIGAAGGVYIAHLLGRASKIFAFEPRPAQAALLRELTSVLRLPIQVEAVALSDRCGTATLRMLSKDLGRSTIDAANALEDPDGSPQTQISVPMRRLDAYELHQLGFMKIDVEGHELAVLDGAEKTIVRTRCNVLVETEERHHAGATDAVFRWMDSRGYVGYFLLDGRLRPFGQFDRELHQNKASIGGWKRNWERIGVYVNNFVFVPAERQTEFLGACRGLGVDQSA